MPYDTHQILLYRSSGREIYLLNHFFLLLQFNVIARQNLSLKNKASSLNTQCCTQRHRARIEPLNLPKMYQLAGIPIDFSQKSLLC